MKFSKFNEHRPVDNRDPGFTLPGFKLRWINDRVSERRTGPTQDLWVPLRLSYLPDELQKKLKTRSPWMMAHNDGDTIRKGGDVLAFAPLDETAKARAAIDNKTREQSSIFNRRPDRGMLGHRGAGQVSIDSKITRERFGATSDED